jgi:hypothetical protein
MFRCLNAYRKGQFLPLPCVATLPDERTTQVRILPLHGVQQVLCPVTGSIIDNDHLKFRIILFQDAGQVCPEICFLVPGADDH